jgi:hypothetical protein
VGGTCQICGGKGILEDDGSRVSSGGCCGFVTMAVLAVGALLVVGVGLMIFHPDSPFKDPGLRETVDASEATAPGFQVGDCVSEPFDPTVVPCDQPHQGEVYAILNVDTDSGDRPSGRRLQDFAAEPCRARFEPYVGRSVDETSLYTLAEPASGDEWAFGAKYILCIVVQDPEYSDLTGSVKGSGR